MDELDGRLDLVKLEWSELQSAIRSHDALRAQIQGWAVTAGLAAAGLGLTARIPTAALLGLFSTASFWVVDAHRRAVQRQLIQRCIFIERTLASGPLSSVLAPDSALQAPSLANYVSATSGSQWSYRKRIVSEAFRPGTWALYGGLAAALLSSAAVAR